MKIQLKSFKNFIVLNVLGEMDYNNSLALNKIINENLNKMNPNIIVNFLKASYIEPSGIKLICDCFERIKELDGCLKIFSPFGLIL